MRTERFRHGVRFVRELKRIQENTRATRIRPHAYARPYAGERVRVRVLYSAPVDLGRLFVYNGDMENTATKPRGRPSLGDRKRTGTVIIRLHPSEKESFAGAAAREGLALSSWIRMLAMRESDRHGSSQAG